MQGLRPLWSSGQETCKLLPHLQQSCRPRLLAPRLCTPRQLLPPGLPWHLTRPDWLSPLSAGISVLLRPWLGG